MITYALFKKMSDDEVAGLRADENFFWEEMPLQSNGKPASGVWLVTRGGDASMSPQALNLKTTVDLYVAMGNKIATEATQQAILEWIIANPAICELCGSVGGAIYSYENVRLRPTTTPQNEGVTENGLIVKYASLQVTYDIKNNKEI